MAVGVGAKRKVQKSLHGLNFSLHMGVVCRLEVYLEFTSGLCVVILG